MRHDGERWLPWRVNAPLAVPANGGWIAHLARGTESACGVDVAEAAPNGAAKKLTALRAAKPGSRLLYIGRVSDAGSAVATIRAAGNCAEPQRVHGEVQLIPSGIRPAHSGR